MDIYTLPSKTIQKELGKRFRVLRLRRNVTQQELATATKLSLNVIKALESGKGKLTSIIAVLRELQCLEQLHNFIPEPNDSTSEDTKKKGKTRKRATGRRKGGRRPAVHADGEEEKAGIEGGETTQVQVNEFTVSPSVAVPDAVEEAPPPTVESDSPPGVATEDSMQPIVESEGPSVEVEEKVKESESPTEESESQPERSEETTADVAEAIGEPEDNPQEQTEEAEAAVTESPEPDEPEPPVSDKTDKDGDNPQKDFGW